MENIPAGTEKTAIEGELPPEAERRLVLRLLGYWRLACEDREFPSLSDIDPAQIPDLWPHCFLLDVVGGTSEPRFREIGDALVSTLAVSPIGQNVSMIVGDSLLGVAVSYVDEMLTRRVPISRGDEMVTAEGAQLLYRSILLPMSDDGETFNCILGAVNCREVPGTD